MSGKPRRNKMIFFDNLSVAKCFMEKAMEQSCDKRDHFALYSTEGQTLKRYGHGYMVEMYITNDTWKLINANIIALKRDYGIRSSAYMYYVTESCEIDVGPKKKLKNYERRLLVLYSNELEAIGDAKRNSYSFMRGDVSVLRDMSFKELCEYEKFLKAKIEKLKGEK